MRTTGTVAAAIGVAVLLFSACGTTVPGIPTGPSGSSRSSAPPLPPGIDTGAYSTELYAPAQGEGDVAWAAEGNRMLETIILPSDIDASLIRPVKGVDAAPTLVSYEAQSVPEGLTHVLSAKVGVSLGRADRTEGATKEVRVGLYRSADASAADTAMTMARSAMSSKPTVTIASAPGAVAAEFEPGTVDAFTRIDALVVHVHARGATVQESASLAERILAAQLPAVREFRPTPDADIPRLPLDRDGVLARSVGVRAASDSDRRFIGALTQPMYERRLADSPVVALFREAGVDLMGWNFGKVLRARDAVAAKRLHERIEQTSQLARVADPPGLEGRVPCRRDEAAGFYTCRMAVGRYYAQSSSPDLIEAQQMGSAQWVVLTRNP